MESTQKRARRRAGPADSKSDTVDVWQDDGDVPESLYERRCRARMEENATLLAELQLPELRQQCLLYMQPKKKVVKAACRKTTLLPQRRSRRLAELATPTLNGNVLTDLQVEAEPPETATVDPPDNFAEALSDCDVADFLACVQSNGRRMHTGESKSSCAAAAAVKRLRCDPNLVTKVVPKRICALAWHPAEDKLLGFAADKSGVLGLWDVLGTSQSGKIFNWRVHNGPVYGMQLDCEAANKLWTAGFDGRVRWLDITTGNLGQLYQEQDERLCSLAVAVPDRQMLTGTGSGQILALDPRCEDGIVHRWDCASRTIKCLSVHPTRPQLVLSSSSSGEVYLWDQRSLGASRSPIALAELSITRCTNSAYFSPLTGNRVVTTSSDHMLRIFKTTTLGKKKSLVKLEPSRVISHNNKTGRWLTPFRAIWHSQREDMILVGSLLTPRRVSVHNLVLPVH